MGKKTVYCDVCGEFVFDPCPWCKVDELEARIDLALRLNSYFVGYVADALKGCPLEKMPKVVQEEIAEQIRIELRVEQGGGS